MCVYTYFYTFLIRVAFYNIESCIEFTFSEWKLKWKAKANIANFFICVFQLKLFLEINLTLCIKLIIIFICI